MKKHYIFSLQFILCLLILFSLKVNAQWVPLGNTGTNILNNYVGTTDLKDLGFRTNSLQRMRILSSNGFVGIGDYTTFTPNTLLHLHQATANTDVNFQMTNNATGSGVTDGFLMHTFPNGITELVQQEPTKAPAVLRLQLRTLNLIKIIL